MNGTAVISESRFPGTAVALSAFDYILLLLTIWLFGRICNTCNHYDQKENRSRLIHKSVTEIDVIKK